MTQTYSAAAAALAASDIINRPMSPESIAILSANDDTGVAQRLMDRFTSAVAAQGIVSALCDLRYTLFPFDPVDLVSPRPAVDPRIEAAIAAAQDAEESAWSAYREEVARAREIADIILSSAPGAKDIIIDPAVA